MDLNKKLLSLQEISKLQLSKILNVVAGKKNVVLESSIIRSLESVCGVQWLKSQGVEKIFKLKPTAQTSDTNPVFYMIHSNSKTFKFVVDQIRSVINPEIASTTNQFHIIMVPKHLYVFEEELEELGLLNSTIKLHSFNWFPISLDAGVLSMEIPSIYGQVFLQKNASLLPCLSNVLWRLHFVFGKPKFSLALGQFSNAILQQVENLSENISDTDKLNSDFGGVILMDRNIDYASALLTPGIYSGLLKEVFEMDAGICEIREDTREINEKCSPIPKKATMTFRLDASLDDVYPDIKNRYFTEVTTVLSNLTKQLKNESESPKDMALEEIKKYVQTRLQATKLHKKNISTHLQAAETIINTLGPRYESQHEIESNVMRNVSKNGNFSFLEEMIYSENDERIVLRLFCLIACTQKLSDAEIGSFWKKFLQQFGFKYGHTYYNLIATDFINLLSESSLAISAATLNKIKIPKFIASNQFYANANRLRQLPQNPDKINLKFPTCASYVFGGTYIPLVTQVASLLLNSTPVDAIQGKLEGLGLLQIKNDKGYPLQSRSILVFIVGGVTYAEIAACNLLETLTGSKIVVLSDKIITGSDLMRDLLEFPR